jgi:hypothetical protein
LLREQAHKPRKWLKAEILSMVVTGVVWCRAFVGEFCEERLL